VIARCADPAEDVAQLRVVVEQAQQRFAACTPLADAENVLRSGIETGDEQVPVQQDDAGAEAVENVLRLLGGRAIVAGTFRARRPAPG
jgi:hypothetical protein